MKKILTLCLFILALFLMMPSASHSAYPKNVLIEEATNTSCGPCASQNPGFEAFCNRFPSAKVIPMKYHAWWPGIDDPMYQHDTAMNNMRIKYYKFETIGVPVCAVNGVLPPKGSAYEGSPGDTAVLRTVCTQEFAKTTPVNLTVTDNLVGNVHNFKVTVETETALSGVKLKVYAVEYKHHYDNMPNGESEFMNVARKMLPDNNGIDLTLAAAGKQTFDLPYTATGDVSNMLSYVVAFVQNDATKEVLQAATNLDVYGGSSITANFRYFELNNSVTKTTKATVTNTTTEKETIKIVADQSTSSIPSDWTVTITPESVDLEAGASADVTLEIKTGTSAAFAKINLMAIPQRTQGGGLPIVSALSFYAMTKNVDYIYFTGQNKNDKLWLDELNKYPLLTSKMAFMPFMDAEVAYNFGLGIKKLAIMPFDETSCADLVMKGDFAPLVINLFENSSKAIITAPISLYYLQTYLSSGANNDAINMISDYMQIQIYGSQPITRATFDSKGIPTALKPYTMKGISGDPVADGMTINCNAGSLTDPNCQLTDIIKIKAGSRCKPMFYYDDSEDMVGAVRYERDNGSRTIYMSSTLAAISDAQQRATFVKKSFDWLGIVTDVTDPVTTGSFIRIAPNPVSSSANVNIFLNSDQMISTDVYLYDAIGNKVADLGTHTLTQGNNLIDLDAAKLSSGVYSVVAKIGGTALQAKVIVVK